MGSQIQAKGLLLSLLEKPLQSKYGFLEASLWLQARGNWLWYMHCWVTELSFVLTGTLFTRLLQLNSTAQFAKQNDLTSAAWTAQGKKMASLSPA